MTPIETERLKLRALTHDDAAFIVELVNEPAFIANIGDKNARDIEGAIRYLNAGPLASYARLGHGLLHVSLKDGGEAIGMCGLLKRDGLDDVDVGFAFLQKHWGRGYAAEAAAACLMQGYEDLGVPRIVGITKPDNIGSQRVLEKIGLVFEKTVQLPGSVDDSYLYVPVRVGSNKETNMKRVLFIGQEPETVDFSDPALPPGASAEKIHAGIAAVMKQMSERGWKADLCLVRPDESAATTLERQLQSSTYDCIVIGGGIRVPPKSLLLFERLVNVVHRSAPGAFLAFNTSPENTADAAARWIEGG